MRNKLFKVVLSVAILLGVLIAASGHAHAFYSETRYLGFDIVQDNYHKYFYITAKPDLMDRYTLAYCEKRYDDTIAVWFQKKAGQEAINDLNGVLQHGSIYYRAVMDQFSANELVLRIEPLERTLENARNPRCSKTSDCKVTITLDKF